MKYNIELDIDHKRPVVPLSLKLDEPLVREFKFVVKQHGKSMTHVLTKMLREFITEYRTKDQPRQKSLL